MCACCVLIGNTAQFKSHNDSHNLCLDFVTNIKGRHLQKNRKNGIESTAKPAQHSEILKCEYLKRVPIGKLHTANLAMKKFLTTNIANTTVRDTESMAVIDFVLYCISMIKIVNNTNKYL